MWGLAIALLIITIVLAILHFTMALAILKILFWIFLGLFVISLIINLARGGRKPIVT